MRASNFDENDLWNHGFARLGRALSHAQCDAVRSLFLEETIFRRTINMQRYRFGRGEYRYFAYPLSCIVGQLRERYYNELAPIAACWMDALGAPQQFPLSLGRFLRACRARNQKRPTPLLLRYRSGDFNCLHQDLYGAIVFPFQVIVSLSDPQTEYRGGELLLVARAPSR